MLFTLFVIQSFQRTFTYLHYPLSIGIHINDLLYNIETYEEENITNGDARLAIAALPHTERHQWLIDEVTNDFLSCLAKMPSDKWKDALVPVPRKGLQGEKTGPKILVELGGRKTLVKVQLANKALIDWMSLMKKKNCRPGKVEWYQPSTQNQRLRTFLGNCSKHYDWNVELSDFSFKGGLKGFIDKLYAKRFKEHKEV